MCDESENQTLSSFPQQLAKPNPGRLARFAAATLQG